VTVPLNFIYQRNTLLLQAKLVFNENEFQHLLNEQQSNDKKLIEMQEKTEGFTKWLLRNLFHLNL
jgi:hypothetical protein